MLPCFLYDRIRALTSVLNHIVKQPFSLDKIIRRALFNHPTSPHHQYLIVVSNSAQSVSNRYHRSLLKLLSNHLLNKTVSLHVHI